MGPIVYFCVGEGSGAVGDSSPSSRMGGMCTDALLCAVGICFAVDDTSWFSAGREAEISSADFTVFPAREFFFFMRQVLPPKPVGFCSIRERLRRTFWSCNRINGLAVRVGL